VKRPTRAPSARIAYVDGRYLPHGQAFVHIEDRGFQLGDSVYEVCNVSGGALIDEAGHLDRLERSLSEIRIPMPMARGALQLVMREMVRRNRLADGLLYMQVTRGTARRDHPIPQPALAPTLVMTARPLNPQLQARKFADGVAVITAPDQRWARRDIKTTQLLPNLLAKTAARDAGALEAWLVDADGFVTEGAAANAWIVDEAGLLVTRSLSADILAGVTRKVILEAAAAAGVPVIERKFTVAEALKAKEAFLSSATGAAVPVVAIDGRPVGDGRPGPLTLRVHGLYAARAGMKSP
jgi:D-alanine transaminase